MQQVGQTPASLHVTLGFRAMPRPRRGAAVRARCPRSTWPTWTTCRRTTASAGLRSCTSRRRVPRPSRGCPPTGTTPFSTSQGRATCVMNLLRYLTVAPLPHHWMQKHPNPPESSRPWHRPPPGFRDRHLSSERREFSIKHQYNGIHCSCLLCFEGREGPSCGPRSAGSRAEEAERSLLVMMGCCPSPLTGPCSSHQRRLVGPQSA